MLNIQTIIIILVTAIIMSVITEIFHKFFVNTILIIIYRVSNLSVDAVNAVIYVDGSRLCKTLNLTLRR